MAEITLEHVEKSYADGYRAVHDTSLQIADGEFMILVGPSGSGKSTLLRMIVGLEDITSGEIRIGGRRVNEIAPRDRNLAMVFQNYALYPHLTVFENIAFPLRLRKLGGAEVRRKVEEAAALLELTEHLERKPSQLSGGQRQRVAMGRAIVREADAFLFDEPLSNLDAQLRGQMRTEIAGLQQRLGVTTVYVTHDQVEAMTLGHRVAVLRKGELQQVEARGLGALDRERDGGGGRVAGPDEGVHAEGVGEFHFGSFQALLAPVIRATISSPVVSAVRRPPTQRPARITWGHLKGSHVVAP